MHRAKQVIPAVDVVYVNDVSVRPGHRPRLNDYEPIAAILETWSSLDNDRMADGKRVFPAKMGPETVVRNVPTLLAFVPLCLLIPSLILTRGFFLLLGVLVFFILIFVFILLQLFILLFVLFVVRLRVGLCPPLLLRMRFVLRINRCGDPKKYSQCRCAENSK